MFELIFFFVVFAINMIIFKSEFARRPMTLFTPRKRDLTTPDERSGVVIDRDDTGVCDPLTDVRIVLKGGRSRCVCRYPLLYTYNDAGTSCNKTAPGVCATGQLDVTRLSVPGCTGCPTNTESRVTDGVPKCAPIDFSRSVIPDIGAPGMVSASSPMIDQRFREKMSGGRVKNPCRYDAITGKFLFDTRVGVSADGVHYCVPTSSSVVSVRADDDYLAGNGGAYANGVVSISNKSAENVIVEWRDENTITIGYRYKTADVHDYILDKFDFGNDAYVNIYNAVVPPTANDIPYPFSDPDAKFSEIASETTPKPAADNLLMHYVLIGNVRVPLISCDKLGTPAVDLEVNPKLYYNKYMFDDTRDVLRNTGYIVCKRPRAPGVIDFVPNLQFKDFTGVVSIDGENVIKHAWYGTADQLAAHKKLHFNM